MKIEVTDNGVGRLQASALGKTQRQKQPVSTKLTSQRLEYFRKTLRKRNISYGITDLFDAGKASGTKVTMMLPYKKILFVTVTKT